jgi:hypothetical protein
LLVSRLTRCHDDNPDVPWLLLLLAYGLVWLAVAIALGVRMPAPDWRAFYGTGRAVLDGTAWYATPLDGVPNLTPPLVAPVFAALSLLPLRVGFLVWTAFGLAASLWVAHRTAVVWRRPTWSVAALVLACHGMPVGLILGQLHLAAFVLVTAAWIADRDNRPLTAGAALGVAIYLKPFFALVIVYWFWRRAWHALVMSVGVAGGAYAVGLLLLPAATAGWLEGIRSVAWQHASVNLSVWGFVARLGLPMWAGVILTALVLYPLIRRLPALNKDGAWFAVLVTACLISPIAWLYYALSLIGPVGLLYQEGDRRARRLVEVGYVALCVPLTFQTAALENGRLLAGTLGSWYLWALVSWWFAGLGSIPNADRVTVSSASG